MKTGVIYKITNLKNGNCYIGKTTKDYLKRFKKHLQNAEQCRDGSYLGKAIRKYGAEHFYIGVIVEQVPIMFLNSFEKYWINYYNSSKEGYNLTLGGDGGGHSMLEKHKQYLKTLFTGRSIPIDIRQKISATLKANPPSPQHIAKMIAARMQLPHPTERALICIETGQIFQNARKAADHYGLKTIANIHQVCKGKRSKAGGYTWKYVNST